MRKSKKSYSIFIVICLLFLVFLINKNNVRLKSIDNFKDIFLNFSKKFVIKHTLDYKYTNEDIIISKDKEINELRNILNVKDMYNFQIVNCHIVERDFNSFSGRLIIDKGKNDGIVKDSAVINDKGLIGIIDVVFNNTSSVRLLINDLNISVQIKNTNFNAIIDGYDYSNNLIKGTLIRSNSNVIKGQEIYTNGYGKRMIGGIKVGKIEDIIDNPNLATREIRIKSDVDFDNINYVSVIIK